MWLLLHNIYNGRLCNKLLKILFADNVSDFNSAFEDSESRVAFQANADMKEIVFLYDIKNKHI